MEAKTHAEVVCFGSDDVDEGVLALTSVQRTWAKLATKDTIDVETCSFGIDLYVRSCVLEVAFMKKNMVTKDRLDTAVFARSISHDFANQVFTVGQTFVLAASFPFSPEPVKFKITVKSMTGMSSAAGGDASLSDGKDLVYGVLTSETKPAFESLQGIPLSGDFTPSGGGGQKSLFDPGWKFDDMGVGGLGVQFREMFRRAFVSRIFPPEVVEKMGISHTKGMMLYGPPGTGKTLMARTIGKMLRGREPKIVNGPEVMSKYVGESEENVRKLFAEAEEEQRLRGDTSDLHIIIFDEIDAICKQRGTTSGGTGTADSVVNQLLSKIDGVEALNNVFLIGMTNRLDMIDEALLRPGRFELKLQIGLPDEPGRLEIFRIHTAKLKANKFLGADVNLDELASRSKNFSGADIAGLIRSAVSFSTERCLKPGGGVALDTDKVKSLKVTQDDFVRALDEVKPAFGADTDEFSRKCDNGIVSWDLQIDTVLETGRLLAQQAARSERTPLVSLLLSGPYTSGKSALASRVSQISGFEFMKLISAETLVGQSETARIARIKKVFDDAYKSPRSVVVIDDIERLIDYVDIGARFSNSLLQALLVLINKLPPPGHRLFVIGTTSAYGVLDRMGVVQQFSKVQHLNFLESKEHINSVLDDLQSFSPSVRSSINDGLADTTVKYSAFAPIPIQIGIKKMYAVAEMAIQAEDSSSSSISDVFLFSLYEECKRNALN